ncbi:MAG: type 1 glutamine amidotransferase domain-containing protein [Planctomycetota bacterium]|jgi:protease I
MPDLSGQRALIFVGADYEDLELQYPKYRLIEAGATVSVIGEREGATYLGKHGYPQVSDAALADVDPADYDALVVPGGWMPDKLRRDPKVLDITRHFAEAGKPLAAICHGGWIPISAGVLKGVKQTGSPGIKDDLINAGAEWIDAPVVVDRHFVSSRRPDDLPDFMRALIEVMGGA